MILINSKDDKIKQKKKIITEALKKLLQRNVYSNISVQEIADEAGYSKGGVLHYFPAKDDIYIELINDMYDELARSHRKMLDSDLNSDEMAPISSLLGVESFVLDKGNIRILINIVLYSFENEVIRTMLRKFFSNHRAFYESIISDNINGEKGPFDLDAVTASRVLQAIIFFVGLIEEVDPIDLDYAKLVRYFTMLIKS
jgi:AcrR family transcriptional regulator